MNITTIGIDLAKNTFSLVGMDKYGKVVLRKTLTRSRLRPFIAQLSPCLIGMEACSGAHYWGAGVQQAWPSYWPDGGQVRGTLPQRRQE